MTTDTSNWRLRAVLVLRQPTPGHVRTARRRWPAALDHRSDPRQLQVLQRLPRTRPRTFSKIDTWRSVRTQLGRYPTLDDLATGGFTAALDHAAAANGGLYTGAFILCATDAYGQGRKHLNHVELWRHMFLTDDLADRVLEAGRLAGHM